MRRIAEQGGQATVELVALLPVLLVLLAGLWQAVLCGQAVWAVASAARAAARAHAVGADAAAAARAHLPPTLEPDLRVRVRSGGEVRVSVRVPALPGLPSPGRVDAGARLEPQS
jgi:TadE-like protein